MHQNYINKDNSIASSTNCLWTSSVFDIQGKGVGKAAAPTGRLGMAVLVSPTSRIYGTIRMLLLVCVLTRYIFFGVAVPTLACNSTVANSVLFSS